MKKQPYLNILRISAFISLVILIQTLVCYFLWILSLYWLCTPKMQYNSFDGGIAGDEGFPECNGWTKITNDTGTSKFRRQMSKTKEPNKLIKTKESLYVKLLN